MEDLRFLANEEKVLAPPDFERMVLGRLASRKKTRGVRPKALGLSLAGSAAAFVACLVLINAFVMKKDRPAVNLAAGNVKQTIKDSDSRLMAPSRDAIEIMERLDYFKNIRSQRTNPETIYLLEQVSYASPQGIKY